VRLDRGIVVKTALVSSLHAHDAFAEKGVGLHKVNSDCERSIMKKKPLIAAFHIDAGHRSVQKATSPLEAFGYSIPPRSPFRSIRCADLHAPHTLFQMPNLAASYIPLSDLYP
jgi:hypothetical protein